MQKRNQAAVPDLNLIDTGRAAKRDWPAREVRHDRIPQAEWFGKPLASRRGSPPAKHRPAGTFGGRSDRVERPFAFIEGNFLAGPSFRTWEDLNQQARQWSDRVNATYNKHIRAVPRELFAVERPHLKPLPAWIPEVYRLHPRTVDVEGYVPVHSIRYSVPVAWIGHRVGKCCSCVLRIW